MTFLLLVEPSGLEALIHTDPPGPDCVFADGAPRQTIDQGTARGILARGEARACEHCQPQP